jgi:hypothetical protein
MTTQELVGHLLEIEIISQIAHWQSASYSQHIALNELYEGIVDIRDKYVESYQGKYGIIKSYPSSTPITEGQDMIIYLKKKCNAIEEFYPTVKEGYLKQILDDLFELLYTTIYKLKNLK